MTGPQRPASGGAASQSDLDFTKRLLAAREAGLDSARTSAAKWHAGLSGLLGGVIGVIGIGLRDTLAEMEAGWAASVAIILMASFVLAFVGLYFALRAAGGVPSLIKTADWHDADGHLAATAAIRQLRAARWLTACAILAFLLGMAATWFAPARAEIASVSNDTKKSCGSVEVSGGNLVLTDAHDQVHVFKMDNIKRWQKLESCPAQ
ncbi:hypothetical protein AB4Z18_13645 [Leifsonia sp. 2TAF2]|uniref:hypothetical protein n=1 Tax=Leifsonia sp. 2TAF2 TaxID=3233009 RepID=UPI003F99D074